MAGVSATMIKDFESGKRNPIRNNLAALRRAFEDQGIHFSDHSVRLDADEQAEKA